MKKIEVATLQELRNTIGKIFKEWDEHPEGVEIAFVIDTRSQPQIVPAQGPAEQEIPW